MIGGSQRQTKVRNGLFRLIVAVLLASPAHSGAEDLVRPGAFWLGHAMPKLDRQGMELGGRVPEATLTGTVMNPANLAQFNLELRWNFGGNPKGAFEIGWGKPSEWGAMDESAGWVEVEATGRTTVYQAGRQIGELQIPVSGRGNASLALTLRSNAVVFAGEGKASVFPLTPGASAAGGYLMLRAEGYDHTAAVLHVERARLDGAGTQPPLSAAQQGAGIALWEKRQQEGNWPRLAAIEAYFQAHGVGRWRYQTDLQLEPGLVEPGETVRLTFHCAGPVPPDSTASVQANFLGATPGTSQPQSLQWSKTSDGANEAVVELKPQQVGNWRVIWRVGGEQLSRVFGVVDDGCAVVRLLETSDRNLGKRHAPPAGFDAVHEAGLACNFWNSGNGIYTPEIEAARYQQLTAFHHLWGDEVIPLVHADTLVPGAPDKNLFKLSDDLQREGLKQTIRLWDLLGLGPLTDLGGYTFGQSTTGIAQSLGIKSIDSLVQWQNWTDLGGNANGWQINDWGAPTVPYYVAADDFRKVAPGRSVVALAQTSTSDARIYSIYTSEGEPNLTFMRRHSDHGNWGESSNIDRFDAAMDLLIAESRYPSGPKFLFVALENFEDNPDWNRANRLGVQYLVEAARHQKMVFVQGAAIADYFRRHNPRQPENWFYWPDIYAGLAQDYKPPQLPDRIEVMNGSFHTVHEDGSALPQFFWDYTQPWSEPEWDEQPANRQQFGLVNPALITAENAVPRMVDLRGVKVAVMIESQAGGATARVIIDSPRALATLPVALWRIPLDPTTVGAVTASAGTRYLRVVDGTTGNLHGLLVCAGVPAGRSIRTVTLSGQARPPLIAEIHFGSQVSGRFFPRGNRPSAYVWLNDDRTAGGILSLRIPSGRTVTVHYNDGQTEQAVGGLLRVELNHAWQRRSPLITGLTNLEIQSGGRFRSGGL